MNDKVCFNCGRKLNQPHRGHCLQKLRVRDAAIGQRVRPILSLTDTDGSVIDEEELGTIELVTRSTIHVRDARGHLHKRYAYFFTAEPRPVVENGDCMAGA